MEELLKALDEIKESYDAFYFINKYDDLTNNTHTKLNLNYFHKLKD